MMSSYFGCVMVPLPFQNSLIINNLLESSWRIPTSGYFLERVHRTVKTINVLIFQQSELGFALYDNSKKIKFRKFNEFKHLIYNSHDEYLLPVISSKAQQTVKTNYVLFFQTIWIRIFHMTILKRFT